MIGWIILIKTVHIDLHDFDHDVEEIFLFNQKSCIKFEPLILDSFDACKLRLFCKSKHEFVQSVRLNALDVNSLLDLNSQSDCREFERLFEYLLLDDLNLITALNLCISARHVFEVSRS